VPILADPLSSLRFGPAGRGRIARVDSLLRNGSAAARLRPDWVIRLGAAPVSKALNQWLEGIPAILVDPGGQWRDPTHDTIARVEADLAHYCAFLAEAGAPGAGADWLAAWTEAEERVNALAGDYLGQAPWCEAQAVTTLIDRLPPGAALFCGNSLPIRQLDTWSGTREAPLTVHGNRGASGIDGNLSTLAGLNAAGVPTLGLIGDLALVHDLSGLLLGDRLRLPLIVVNNGGGRIFDYLPQHGLPGFEALWRTPVGLDLSRLAGLFGLPYRQAADAPAFDRALEETLDSARPGLIELRIDAAVSEAVHRGFWARVGGENLSTP
jgi:2-succinyl-5-enolpyruvyl-6-hydroxy-3-cyclohexene-1-carboxylate synthase